MLLIIGTIRLPAQNLPAARSAMRRMVDASRAEPGCVLYVYAEDMFDAGLIHVKEIWSDRDALDHHFAAPHLTEWRAVWDLHGIGHRNLKLYELGRPQAI